MSEARISVNNTAAALTKAGLQSLLKILFFLYVAECPSLTLLELSWSLLFFAVTLERRQREHLSLSVPNSQ